MAKTINKVTDWTVIASVVDVSFCSVVPACLGERQYMYISFSNVVCFPTATERNNKSWLLGPICLFRKKKERHI